MVFIKLSTKQCQELSHVLEQRQLTRQIVSAVNFQRTEKFSRLVFLTDLDGIIILCYRRSSFFSRRHSLAT